MENKANQLGTKHRKSGELEYDILRTIANNGAQSVKAIATAIRVSEPTVSRKIKEISKKDPKIKRLVIFRDTADTQGREHYYVLTDNGIKDLISENNQVISSQIFWNMMYYSFHNTSESILKNKIEYYVSLYGNRILGFSFDHVQFYSNLWNDMFYYYSKRMMNENKIGKAFDKIGYNKFIDVRTLETLFGEKISTLFYQKRRKDGRQFFDPISIEGSKIELNIFGVLLLLCRLGQKAKENVSSKIIESKINIIRSKYGKLIPLIFNHWDELEEMTKNKIQLLGFFKALLQPRQSNIREDVIKELFDLMSSMEDKCRYILENEFEIACNAILNDKKSTFYNNLKRYTTSKGIYKPSNSMLNNPLFSVLNKFAILLNNDVSFGVNISNYSDVIDERQRRLADTISFRFYALLFNSSSISSENLQNFLHNNPEIKNMYNDWLKEITRYAEQNIIIYRNRGIGYQ